ncbi:TPA: tRNA (N(6)-L-threonylcarbamoyladenosine(37)-C(2))-methylthiotransferase MtaB [Candidatus Poribacteria bacterium]|nr:tRNA (N(6)-L-threonylcarbamoyladenosine(37)-C(2))-methylthiotransferase MtaB [Candidatus Poribacteria bacterium]
MRTVSFLTLGCKVNQYDTQVMRESLKKAGYTLTKDGEKADIYVLNTCTVTSISDRKSRQIIRKIKRQNPQSILIVTGCYAERCPDEILSLDGVDLVLSNKDKPFIDQFLNNLLYHSCISNCISKPSDDIDLHTHITTFDGQTRAIVKIEDGCDSMCSYCIVPYVRGKRIKSRPIDSIIHEVSDLAGNGYKEIVLTGIHLGAYGKDLSYSVDLADVLNEIHKVDGIERIRFSSIEPMDLTEKIIDTVSKLPKCAHHFHIPLQSGSDRILNLMRRSYTASDFEKLIINIRAKIPDVGISSDIMVGFPGETDQDFKATCDLVSRMKLSRLHVFRYSPREGTPASKFPNRVPDRISSKRSDEAIELGHRLMIEFYSQMIGQTHQVLIEDTREGKDQLLAGWTSNYARVLVKDADQNDIGHIRKIQIIGIDENHLIGIKECENEKISV